MAPEPRITARYKIPGTCTGYKPYANRAVPRMDAGCTVVQTTGTNRLYREYPTLGWVHGYSGTGCFMNLASTRPR